MDNDAIIAADADTDIAARFQESEHSDTLAIDSIHHPVSEQTPLLDANRNDEGEDNGRENGQGAWIGNADFKDLHWWRKPSIFWILPPFLMVALAFSGVLVPKLELILTLICQEYLEEKSSIDPNFTSLPVIFGKENPQCRLPEVSARVAQFSLYGSLFSGILSAITSPKLGALSDRYGRKPLIVLTSFGMIASEVITIIAGAFPDRVSVNWILVGYALDGLSGSFIASMATIHSYITDCTPPTERSVAFGYLHGCLAFGIALGPICAAKIIELTDSILSIFYLALGSHILFILFVFSFIPESLTKERQHEARDKHRRNYERVGRYERHLRELNIFEPLQILHPTSPGSSMNVRRNMLLLASVDTLCFGVAMSSMSVIVIYTNYQFGWGTTESSRFISIVSAFRVCGLMLILPIVKRIIKGPKSKREDTEVGADGFELSVIRVGVLFDTIGYLGYSLTRTGALFTLSGAVASIGSVASPTISAALTKHVPRSKTGELLGTMGLLHSLARVVGPTVFSGIYSITVGKFTQTVFVGLTAIFGIAFLFSWFIRPHVGITEVSSENAPVIQSEETDDN